MKLFATIRRDSQYANQRTGKPFAVTLENSGEHIWRGGPGGCYRTSDLHFYSETATGELTPLELLTGCEQVLARQIIRNALTANSRPWLEALREILREGMQAIDTRILEVERELHCG